MELKIYEVYKGLTKKVVARGTAIECANKLNLTKHIIYDIASATKKGGKYRGFRCRAVGNVDGLGYHTVYAIYKRDKFIGLGTIPELIASTRYTKNSIYKMYCRRKEYEKMGVAYAIKVDSDDS